MIDFKPAVIATMLAASVVLMGLNVFLSTRKNPMFAFIMPAISFVFSVVFLVLNLTVVSADSSSESFAAVVKSFFIFNIPTLVFIFTSLATRYLHKKL
ncbi:MAG: hypothetical protein IJU39_00500 [Clostridia bacterium]|nr:hypothetical protein [Clostridia bacterium]